MRAGAGNQLSGQTVGAKGNQLYVAPGFANLGAHVLSNWKAGRMEDDADTRLKNMGVERTDRLRNYSDAFSGGRRHRSLPYMGEEGE